MTPITASFFPFLQYKSECLGLSQSHIMPLTGKLAQWVDALVSRPNNPWDPHGRKPKTVLTSTCPLRGPGHLGTCPPDPQPTEARFLRGRGSQGLMKTGIYSSHWPNAFNFRPQALVCWDYSIWVGEASKTKNFTNIPGSTHPPHPTPALGGRERNLTPS